MVSRVELLDYDADGANELLFTSLECQALLKRPWRDAGGAGFPAGVGDAD